MATWNDVRRLALALPETVEKAPHDWRLKDELLAWERPLRKSDLAALGDDAPKGPILGAWVPDLDTKEARIAARPDVFFTTPHFDGYPAVLVRLPAIDEDGLRELLEEAWLSRAPKRLAASFRAADSAALKPRAAPRRTTSSEPRAGTRSAASRRGAGRRG